MATTEYKVASITTEDFSMVIKTVVIIPPVPTIINLKSMNQRIKNTSGNFQTAMLYLWLSKPLRKRLSPTETSELKSTNTISNRAIKRVKLRQYDEQPWKTRNEHNEITEYIPLEGDVLSYVPLKFPSNQKRKALFDTGACANAISERDYEDLKSSFGTTASHNLLKSIKSN